MSDFAAAPVQGEEGGYGADGDRGRGRRGSGRGRGGRGGGRPYGYMQRRPKPAPEGGDEEHEEFVAYNGEDAPPRGGRGRGRRGGRGWGRRRGRGGGDGYDADVAPLDETLSSDTEGAKSPSKSNRRVRRGGRGGGGGAGSGGGRGGPRVRTRGGGRGGRGRQPLIRGGIVERVLANKQLQKGVPESENPIAIELKQLIEKKQQTAADIDRLLLPYWVQVGGREVIRSFAEDNVELQRAVVSAFDKLVGDDEALIKLLEEQARTTADVLRAQSAKRITTYLLRAYRLPESTVPALARLFARSDCRYRVLNALRRPRGGGQVSQANLDILEDHFTMALNENPEMALVMLETIPMRHAALADRLAKQLAAKGVPPSEKLTKKIQDGLAKDEAAAAAKLNGEAQPEAPPAPAAASEDDTTKSVRVQLEGLQLNPKTPVTLVDNAGAFDQALGKLRSANTVALDIEFTNFLSVFDRVCVFQLASDSGVQLIDVVALQKQLQPQQWQALVQQLFNTDNQLLLGYNILADAVVLKFSFLWDYLQSIWSAPKGVLDVQQLILKIGDAHPDFLGSLKRELRGGGGRGGRGGERSRERKPKQPTAEIQTGGDDKGEQSDGSKPSSPDGKADTAGRRNYRTSTALVAVIGEFLQKDLDKTQQLSCWLKRPLRNEQKAYAALDAQVLLELYNKIQQRCQQMNINFEEYKAQAIVSSFERPPRRERGDAAAAAAKE